MNVELLNEVQSFHQSNKSDIEKVQQPPHLIRSEALITAACAACLDDTAYIHFICKSRKNLCGLNTHTHSEDIHNNSNNFLQTGREKLRLIVRGC